MRKRKRKPWGHVCLWLCACTQRLEEVSLHLIGLTFKHSMISTPSHRLEESSSGQWPERRSHPWIIEQGLSEVIAVLPTGRTTCSPSWRALGWWAFLLAEMPDTEVGRCCLTALDLPFSPSLHLRVECSFTVVGFTVCPWWSSKVFLSTETINENVESETK